MVEYPTTGSPEKGPTIKQKLLELADSGLRGADETIANFSSKDIQRIGRSFHKNFLLVQAIAEGMEGDLTLDKQRQPLEEARYGIRKTRDLGEMFQGEHDVVRSIMHFEHYFQDLESLATG